MSYPIKFKRLHPDAVLPSKTEDNAGYDLHIVEDTLLEPFVPTLVDFGFSTQFPISLEGSIRPRSSSLLKRRIHIATGLIDASYRGSWGTVAMYIPILTTKKAMTGYRPSNGIFGPGGDSGYFGSDSFISGDLKQDTLLLRKGERIAQVVFSWLPNTEWQEVEELGESIRNMGGFGSSGV